MYCQSCFYSPPLKCYDLYVCFIPSGDQSPPPESMPGQPRVLTERRRSFGEDEDKHRRSNSAPAKKVEVRFGHL